MQSFLLLYNDCSEIKVSLEGEKSVIKGFLISFKCYLVTLLSLQADAKLSVLRWSGLCPNVVAGFANPK